ncbi:uncharacterized protein LOC105214918 [Zeugodacus cucurbitae]|uniref:uncharacterized protein LOC105214918 n=1 Tax=Zeugodacus cucurbitae TaxID=28588 RepID=UPI000596798B|nr:uncharacterized protein LOC105214918 [Zeugodacus cucurbitae]
MNSNERLIFITVMLFSLTLATGIPVDSSQYDLSNQNISNLCAEREVVGVVANPSDTDCTSYIHCYNQYGEWLAKLLKCPEGQFFDTSMGYCSSLYNCSL